MRRIAWPLWLEISAVVLVTLVVSNCVTIAVAEYRRFEDVRVERLEGARSRLSALVELLVQVPEAQHRTLLTVASVRRERVSIGARPRVAFDAKRDAAAEARLRTSLAGSAVGEVRVARRGTPELNLFGPRKANDLERLSIAIAIAPGRWLNAEFMWPVGASLLPGLLFSAGVASLGLIGVSVWLAYRLSQPMEDLMRAAAQIERGETSAPLALSGPHVVRETAKAFNTMSRRVTGLVESQRLLLSSLGHDLRTPITSMRLKAEMVDDEDLRGQIGESLDELQSLTECALEATRVSVGEEPSREMDVTALIESLVADHSTLGEDVTFVNSEPIVGWCRPMQIKRAVRNLIENAVKYGGTARVRLERAGPRVFIEVDDDGPEVSEEGLTGAFDPFVRLPNAEARGVKGFGLGLTIARAVARAHEGDVELRRRQGGGVSARLSLVLRPAEAVSRAPVPVRRSSRLFRTQQAVPH